MIGRVAKSRVGEDGSEP